MIHLTHFNALVHVYLLTCHHLAAVESKLLKARIKMQQKYIDQFHMLYDDFNITKLPLLPEEARNPSLDITIYQTSIICYLLK
jgi:anion-transporting  ArsA/GET3 family ATPase